MLVVDCIVNAIRRCCRLVALGRKSGSPKSGKMAEDLRELEECGVRIKDSEDDVVKLTGLDDEREAEENIKVGKLGEMSAEDTSRELWVNTHVLHSKKHFERMKFIADSSIPPLKICDNLDNLVGCKRVEYLARAIQEYLEITVAQLLRLAKHRRSKSSTDKTLVTEEDLKTLVALHGEIF